MHIYEPGLCIKLTGLKMSMGARIMLIFGLELSACFQSIMTESIWMSLPLRQRLTRYHVTPLSYTTRLCGFHTSAALTSGVSTASHPGKTELCSQPATKCWEICQPWYRHLVTFSWDSLEEVQSQPVLTSAVRQGEVPGSGAGGGGQAWEHSVALQHVTQVAAVADLVPDV